MAPPGVVVALPTDPIGPDEPSSWIEIALLDEDGAPVADEPYVVECAVYGVSDQVKGEVPMAAIVLAAGAEASSEDLERFCRERLATYKIPRSFDVVETLPKNATGKILKRILRDQAQALA